MALLTQSATVEFDVEQNAEELVKENVEGQNVGGLILQRYEHTCM